MPRDYRYWRTDGQLHLNPPGIRVVDRDTDPHYIAIPETGGVIAQPFPDDFSRAVRDNLNYLHQTVVGQVILNHLSATALRPTIQPAFLGNAVQFVGTTGMKPAALELHRLRPGDQVRTAVLTMIGHRGFLLGSQMIASAVRSTPEWSLEHRPGYSEVASQSWTQLFLQGRLGNYAQHLRDRLYQKLWGWDTNEGYSEDELYVSSQRGISQRGIYVTRDEIQSWLVGETSLPGRLSEREKRHVANVTIAVLYAHSADGAGAAGAIEWRHQRDYDLNDRRPPAIGLAHELIHAYHGSLGRNPGTHDTPPSVVLFEFLCVGLGPFANEAVTENTVRSQWAGAVAHIPAQDLQNRRIPGKRISYL